MLDITADWLVLGEKEAAHLKCAAMIKRQLPTSATEKSILWWYFSHKKHAIYHASHANKLQHPRMPQHICHLHHDTDTRSVTFATNTKFYHNMITATCTVMCHWQRHDLLTVYVLDDLRAETVTGERHEDLCGVLPPGYVVGRTPACDGAEEKRQVVLVG